MKEYERVRWEQTVVLMAHALITQGRWNEGDVARKAVEHADAINTAINAREDKSNG